MKFVCPNCRKCFALDFFPRVWDCVQCGTTFELRVRYPHYDEHRDEMSEQDKRLENFHCGAL